MLTNLQVTHEFQFNANANLEQVVESLRVCTCVSCDVYLSVLSVIGMPR